MATSAPHGVSIVTLLDASAGAALLAGAVTPWLRSGQGHTLRGLDLADQLLGGQLSPSWGRTVGLALYACVTLGALLLASSAFRNWRLDAVRLGVGVLMLTAAAVVVAMDWFPLELWGLAPILAVTAFAVSCAANSWSMSRGGRTQAES
jgi:hypothetical protein